MSDTSPFPAWGATRVLALVVMAVCIAIAAVLPRFYVEEDLAARAAIFLFVGGVAFLIAAAPYLRRLLPPRE